MRSLLKGSLLMVVLGFFSSCSVQVPLSTIPPSNNKTYEVEYLFEHDGCKVYRFRDAGNYIYFTNCRSDVTAIENDSTHIRVVNVVK